MHEVLGIGIDDHLLALWRSWYSPARQPFPVDGLAPGVSAHVPVHDGRTTAEWRDTFFLYHGTWTWLSEEEFAALPPAARRALLSRRRARMRPKPQPVWPSAMSRQGDAPLLAWIESGVRPSAHARVSGRVWERARHVLPGAESLAGTFPDSGSGPNCFATVVAAANGLLSHDGASTADEWMQTEDFAKWLSHRTSPWTGTDRDAAPGTVLTWTERGQLAHAAVTIGDGWVLNKPSQSWSSPRLVWSTRDLVQSWRLPGTKLSRHVLSS